MGIKSSFPYVKKFKDAFKTNEVGHVNFGIQLQNSVYNVVVSTVNDLPSKKKSVLRQKSRFKHDGDGVGTTTVQCSFARKLTHAENTIYIKKNKLQSLYA